MSKLSEFVRDLLDGDGDGGGLATLIGQQIGIPNIIGSPVGTPPFNPAAPRQSVPMPDLDIPTAIKTAEVAVGRGNGQKKFAIVAGVLLPVLAARIGLPLELLQLLGRAIINAGVKRMNQRGELPTTPVEENKYLPERSFTGAIPPDSEIVALGYAATEKNYVYISLDGTGWGVAQANHLPIEGYKPHHKLSAD